MTDTSQPEWLKGYNPSHSPPPTRWTAGMRSPNPKGRPKGIIDKRTRVSQALMDDAPAVARVVIDAALEGDMQAASLVLSRVAPPIKAQAERVQFELSADVPLSEQAHQILIGVSEGRLDAETAKTLIGCIESVSAIKSIEELEQRLVILEMKQVA